MISLKKIFFWLTAACLLFPACNEQLFDTGDNGNADASGLILSLSVEGMGPEIATRVAVAAEEGEEYVHTLTLFFFEPSGNRTGMLVDWVKLGSDGGPSMGMNTAIPIPTEGKLISASGAYNVIGVANATDYMDADWELDCAGMSEMEFRREIFTKSAFPTIETNNLLMNGSAVKTAGKGRIDMKLTRNVVRIDVENKAVGYALESARLANIYRISSVMGDATLDFSSDNTSDRSGASSVVTSSNNEPIKGKLYAFENRTTAPSMGDKVTTCLLVGLKKSTATTPKYYRINIHPDDEGQYLRRNKVYAISINDINGEGYSSMEEALEGTKESELDYTINNWDLGDNGLIVSDSYSILALPVKVAQIGKDGAALNYDVTTFSTLESPSPLKIERKSLDDGLTVTLVGNTLTVSAIPLDFENQIREGSVTLSYAGLEATMDIVQSLKVKSFLKLSYETGWNGLFSALGGDVSKLIYVNASGSWKATLIGDEGFSFDQNNSVLEYSSNNPNGDFHVISIMPNSSMTSRRNAFVIVTLDDDPLNCVGVVSLSQAIASNITISPLKETVTFEGSSGADTPNQNKNIFTFTNIHYYEEDELGTNPVALIASITEGSEKFECVLTGDPSNYTLEVWTKGTNISPSNYTGKLKITTNPAGSSELVINLVQQPLPLSVGVTQPTTVSPKGEETGSFNLSIADNNAKWTANVVVRGENRDIFNHNVRLVYADGARAGETVDPSDQLSVDTPVKLIFPKVYFPNREIAIQAIVTFTTTAGATATYTFKQNKLTTEGLRIWSTYYTRWGSLSPSGNGYYMEYFNQYIQNKGATLASPGTYSLISSSSSGDYGNNVPNNTNWYQFSNNDANSSARFTGVNNYFKTYSPERLTVLQAGHGALSEAFNAYSFAKDLEYEYVNSSVSANQVRLNNDNEVKSTRVYQFIIEKGRNSISNIDGFGLYNDGVNGGIKSYPAGAVPLLRYSSPSGDYNLVIDPKNNLVIHGDETVFYGSYYTNNSPVNASDKSAFMANYIDYLVNAAKYGTHFTDMMRDDMTAIPPIWDDVWGDNKWPTRSN